MTALNWSALVVHTALVLAAALFGLSAAVHFPAENRPLSLQTGLGRAILWCTISATILAAVVGSLVAIQALPWPLAILATSAALLAAPLLLQRLSDHFVDGRGALLVFSGLSALCAVRAWCIPT